MTNYQSGSIINVFPYCSGWHEESDLLKRHSLYLNQMICDVIGGLHNLKMVSKYRQPVHTYSMLRRMKINILRTLTRMYSKFLYSKNAVWKLFIKFSVNVRYVLIILNAWCVGTLIKCGIPAATCSFEQVFTLNVAQFAFSARLLYLFTRD